MPALVTIAAVYGAADAFFAPAFTGLLPATVSPVNLQPANALRGLAFSLANIGGPIVAGLLIAYAGGPGGALLFDAVTFVVSIGLLLPLRPRVVEEVLHEEDPTATTRHFWTSLREGWGEVRSRSWLVAFLAGMSVYHVVVLPSIFVIGPVLMQQELDGACSWAVIVACFGVGNVLGDLLFLRWRPRFALRVASLLLVGASCQAAMIGSGLGTWGIGAGAAGGRLRHRRLHAVGDLSGRARPGPVAVAGVELRLPGHRGDPARQPDRRRRERGVRAARHAAGHDGDRRGCVPGGRGRARRAHVAAGRGHGARPGLGRLGQRHVHRQRHQGVVGGEVHDVGLHAGGPAGRVEAARPRRGRRGRDRRDGTRPEEDDALAGVQRVAQVRQEPTNAASSSSVGGRTVSSIWVSRGSTRPSAR